MKAAISLSIWLGLASLGWLQARGETVEPFRPTELLRNMPVNSDHRCLGITLVAEALFEGQLVSGADCDQPQELAKRIFENAGTSSATSYRSKVCLEHGPTHIQSPEALDRLSEEVANLYKQRHLELMATPEGRRKLVTGQQAKVRTARELDEILDADRDKTHAFIVIGIRQFPDASEKPTYHVVLIAKSPDGKKTIYDPNDPGSAVGCRMTETPAGLLVKWTCKYKDTGQVTTQEYQIVDRAVFFRLALAKE